ncbi:MAG: radical SAM protein [Elusimicrobiota bacterium]
MSYPAYVDTYRSGRLREKVEQAVEGLRSCRACPRDCKVDRLGDDIGACKTGRKARVDSCFPHLGEEDVLRGWNGSGTIFFSACNLRCQFCQNWDISQAGRGEGVEAEAIAGMALELQKRGCHNINFVTPEHVVPQVLEAVLIAAEKGLRLPLVYNTSAYDSVESLRLMDDVADIYMPDFKFWDPELCRKYLKAEDYADRAREALMEMHRQVGPLKIDAETDLAQRGILLRHLVMPGCLEDSGKIFKWLAEELSCDTYVNIMDQYHPAGAAQYDDRFAEIQRCLTQEEHRRAVELAREAGLHRFDYRRPHSLLRRFL